MASKNVTAPAILLLVVPNGPGRAKKIAPEKITPMLGGAVSTSIVSNPPLGCHKVLNIYVDPDGKLKYTFDDSGG